MPIQNGIGITGYSRTLPRGFEGQWADYDGGRARPMPVPLVSKISNIAISGFGADTDSITVHIDKPDGTRESNTVTRAAGVPVDDAAAAVALAALINADEQLNGVVVATTSTSNLILTFDHPNIDYPVSTAVLNAVATVTTTRAAGGTAVTIGRFVKGGTSIDGQPAVEALAATDDEWAILGVTLRTLDRVNAESPLATAVDQIPAGKMAPVAYKGNVYMKNTGAVASAPNGVVYVTVETTGGGEVGAASAQPTGATPLFTCTPVAVNDQEYGLQITWRGSTYSEIVQADGSATATEICDAFRTRFGTIAGLTFGGTATLTITGSAGEPLAVNDLGPGDMGVVATTASDPYVIAMDRKRAHWTEATAAGAIGPVHLDL